MTRWVGTVVVFVALVPAYRKNADAEVPDPRWQPDRSRTRDDECVPVQGCCPEPCSGNVVNRRDATKVVRQTEAKCAGTNRATCPVAGSCAEHAFLCVRGTCALVLAGSPDWRVDAGTR